MVFLRLQPYRQSSIPTRRSMKLAPWVGKVSYGLDLPWGSTVHPAFQVSSLKQVIGRTDVKTQDLPTFGDTGELQMTSFQVLESRNLQKKGRALTQFLIQWANLTPEHATWEDAQFLHERFHDFQP